ncbi:EF-hand domain-containing protein [Undibacterium sp. Di27W]|uniref:EF-hand domain-containing protein n=1 Tax=Undibacterium sp. Di27W TaxID=3413036 RepID=UPI003BEFAA69
MSSITGLSGSSNSYFQQTGSTQRRERDTSKIADNVFSRLDTKNQGYLEIQDLETAFSNIAGNSTSSTDTASSTASSSTSNTASTDSSNNTNSSINDLFKKLDSNGDGKLTKSEFSDGIKKLSDALEGQFNARRTRGAEGSRPPPPPPEGGGGPDKAGLDKTQLIELSAKVGQSNSSAGAALSQVAQNFDAADTNQDGKVSLQETLAYLEKTIQSNSTGSTSGTASSSTADSSSSNSSSTNSSTGSTTGTSDGTATSSTASNSTDAALFKKALQLLRAYNSPATASTPSIAVSA